MFIIVYKRLKWKICRISQFFLSDETTNRHNKWKISCSPNFYHPSFVARIAPTQSGHHHPHPSLRSPPPSPRRCVRLWKHVKAVTQRGSCVPRFEAICPEHAVSLHLDTRVCVGLLSVCALAFVYVSVTRSGWGECLWECFACNEKGKKKKKQAYFCTNVWRAVRCAAVFVFSASCSLGTIIFLLFAWAEQRILSEPPLDSSQVLWLTAFISNPVQNNYF